MNFVEIGPSDDSPMRILAEFVLVTSMQTKFGGSGGFVWSHPNSIRRKPLMRRSHIPICLSVSVPVQPDTDGPAYAVPVNIKCQRKRKKKENWKWKLNGNTSISLLQLMTQINVINTIIQSMYSKCCHYIINLQIGFKLFQAIQLESFR